MRAVLLSCLLALLIAGCGGGSGSSSSSGGGDTDSATTPPLTQTVPKTAAPPQEGTVVGMARDTGPINAFYTALQQAKLVDRLSTPGPFTVFVPTNAAFTAGGPEAFAKTLKSSDLEKTLLGHVVAGRHPVAALKDGTTLKTLAGTTLKVGRSGGAVTIGGKRIAGAELTAGNGLVEPIDGVLSGS